MNANNVPAAVAAPVAVAAPAAAAPVDGGAGGGGAGGGDEGFDVVSHDLREELRLKLQSNSKLAILVEEGDHFKAEIDEDEDLNTLDVYVNHFFPTTPITTVHIFMGKVERLGMIMPRMIHLKRLIIGCSEIARGTLAEIAPRLPISLETIDISALHYDENDFISLVMNLPRLPSLAKLDLNQCLLSDAWAHALAAAMPGMQSLTTLYLSQNRITAHGAIAIVRALPRLMTYVTYTMSRASVAPAAAAAGGGAASVAASPAVVIDLIGNPIDEAAKPFILPEVPLGCLVRL
jgi:hypothetical protein